MTRNYASFEGHPCVFNDTRGWVMWVREVGWREFPSYTDILQYAKIMSEEEFQYYRNLPPLPQEFVNE
jgi:hypothetical protein